MPKELRFYRTKDGKEPFSEWLDSIKDKMTKAQITNRLIRVTLGNFGDSKSVGEGVSELRIHYAGGYRVYYAEQEQTIVLLLSGGSKKTQVRDIEKAKRYLADFRERCYD